MGQSQKIFWCVMLSFLAGMWRSDIAIDLGTANTLVFVKGEGIVIEEPSVVAYEVRDGKKMVYAVGEKAKPILGRTNIHTHGRIEAIRPMRDGVIADFEVAQEMIKHFFRQVTSPFTFTKPRVIVCVPFGSTTVERRTIRESVLSAGASRVGLISEPIAAAIGSGICINESNGSMVVDIGGGTTDIAAISAGGIINAKSINCAGDTMDQAIIDYMREEHELTIGTHTAEQIKNVLGTAMPPKDGEGESLNVRGLAKLQGTPAEVELNQFHVAKALSAAITDIARAVAAVVQQTPPEISNDISSTGIVLTGGGAKIQELDTVIRKRVNLPVVTADDPLRCVAAGTGQALDLGIELSHIIDYTS